MSKWPGTDASPDARLGVRKEKEAVSGKRRDPTRCLGHPPGDGGGCRVKLTIVREEEALAKRTT
jgi:hypothetical protein